MESSQVCQEEEGRRLLQLAQQPGVRLLDVSVARENSVAAAERNDARNLFSTMDFHAGVSAVRMTRTEAEEDSDEVDK